MAYHHDAFKASYFVNLSLPLSTCSLTEIKLPRAHSNRGRGPFSLSTLLRTLLQSKSNQNEFNSCEWRSGPRLVSTKRIYTSKTKDGEAERCKARRVARGYLHRPCGWRHHAFSSKLALECSPFDIRNSSTESRSKQEVYLARPEKLAVTKDRVLHVFRSLNGVSWAGRQKGTDKEGIHPGSDRPLTLHSHEK